MKLYKQPTKDERAVSIENISYKYGYNLISMLLLLDVVYRAIIRKEAAWDLLWIVIISGLIMIIYQFKQKILDKNYIKLTVISLVAAFLIPLFIMIIKNYIS